MERDDRQQLMEELCDLVWFRLALALVPAIRVLGCSKPRLAWVMKKILEEIEEDVAAYVSMYDVHRRKEEDE